MGVLVSVNIGRLRPLAGGTKRPSGILKEPVEQPVLLSDPGPRQERRGTGSGVEGDRIGNRTHHGGYWQAVYAFAREELDGWASDWAASCPTGPSGRT